MGNRSRRRQLVSLPLVLFATFVVAVCPSLLVWWLRDSGAVASAWVGIGIGVAASFAASYVGATIWKTRTGSRDVLFSELMLWGWVQRWRSERRLAIATDVLGLRHGPRRKVPAEGLSHEQQCGLLTQLASSLEAGDPYTHGHSRRVARYASNIAKRMGLSTAEVAKIRTAGVIHDVGKVKTPTTVLHKQGALTDGELKVLQRHPVQGATMVSAFGDDELTAIVRHHHERLDGAGYPDRLAGDAIPLGARIIAVADTFDAITSTRPYRQAHAHKEALDILTDEAGTQLDPNAVRAFCSYYTGRRALALWTILAHGPPKLASWLGGGLSSAKAASVANVMLTAAATGAVGGAALGPLVEAPVRAHPPAKSAAVTGVAPATREPSVSAAAAGGRDGRGDRRVKLRGEVQGHRFIRTTPAGAWERRRKARGTSPLSRAGAPSQGNGAGGRPVPGSAPGHSEGHRQGKPPAPSPGKKNRPGSNSPRGGPDHRKGGQGQEKRPGPDGAAGPRDTKTAPVRGKGHARNPDDTSTGPSDPRPTPRRQPPTDSDG